MKRCRRCGRKKSVKNFTVNNSFKDKLDIHCKKCIAISNKKKRLLLAIKKGIYLSARDGFDPDFEKFYIRRECEICETEFLPHRITHKRCKSCTYIARNIVHHSLTGNRPGIKTWKRKVKPSHVIEISKRYVRAPVCCYCARNFTESNSKTLEHILPVCLGGTNDPKNINISCAECNKSKASLPVDKWIELCQLVISNFKIV